MNSEGTIIEDGQDKLMVAAKSDNPVQFNEVASTDASPPKDKGAPTTQLNLNESYLSSNSSSHEECIDLNQKPDDPVQCNEVSSSTDASPSEDKDAPTIQLNLNESYLSINSSSQDEYIDANQKPDNPLVQCKETSSRVDTVLPDDKNAPTTQLNLNESSSEDSNHKEYIHANQKPYDPLIQCNEVSSSTDASPSADKGATTTQLNLNESYLSNNISSQDEYIDANQKPDDPLSQCKESSSSSDASPPKDKGAPTTQLNLNESYLSSKSSSQEEYIHAESVSETVPHQETHHSPKEEDLLNKPKFTNNWSIQEIDANEEVFDHGDSHHYTRKEKGRGFCVIYANYLDDLKGYKKDVNNIKHFFEDELHFDVKVRKQLEKEELRKDLLEIRGKLNKDNRYDRLFVFVLSHGCQKGIICQSEKEEHDDEDVIPVQEIIDNFTHDKVKTLRNCPKCFFFQTCRGLEPARSAASVSRETSKPKQEMPKIRRILVQTDVLVAYPTLDSNPSFVSQSKGSFFITRLLEAMRTHQKEHLADILTHVTREVSVQEYAKKYKYLCNSDDHQILVKHQEKTLPLKICMETKIGGDRIVCGELDDQGIQIKRRHKIPHSVPATWDFKCKIFLNKTQLCFKHNPDPIEIHSDKDLEPFAHRSFSITGTLEKENGHKIEGEVYKMKHDWYIDEGAVNISEKRKGHCVFGMLRNTEEDIIIQEKDLCGLRVHLATPEGVLCEEGELALLDKDYNQYGMRATPKQLPIYTSMLTRKLYLQEPPIVEDINGDDTMKAVVRREMSDGDIKSSGSTQCIQQPSVDEADGVIPPQSAFTRSLSTGDEIDMFFQSIIPTVKRLNRKQQGIAKVKMQSLLFEIEFPE